MKIESIKTLGDLKKAKYQSKSIKDELRDNLIHKIKNNEAVIWNELLTIYVLLQRVNRLIAKTFIVLEESPNTIV